ncbi:murein L,D-transpeptidase catalytic domain family protein [Flavobacterium psychrotrophum]|uniref:murein L,D-transpeptidase catalytic domain family protein n=1 Tax=Flavobacterium psychrotrophum TaxID=2294119 RepID=UPI000E316D73|nr:murein L,D-transpeptidase catalytic domain family protein [Flavobacterium psychrotrophum]
MVYNFFTSVLFLFFSYTNAPKTNTAISAPVEKTAVTETESLYNALSAHNAVMPTMQCFEKAVKGYNLLKTQGKIQRHLLTVIDFSRSSNTKRLWIIDMDMQSVVYNTLVAHGRNSGDEFAQSFSNTNSSNMSSLGFYATGELYNGKHGQSLKLDGLENGLNSNARSRGVVMHAADYVSETFIKLHHRLGRSQGCPALPSAITKEVINLIKGKSCLFIYHPEYNRESKILS